MEKMTLNESELIGMHVGDGSLYNTNRSPVWEIRGSLDEKEYYLHHVKPLLESVFPDLQFKPKFRSGGKNGCFGIQTSKKTVVTFFEKFKFLPGSKVHSVGIPKHMFKSGKENQYAFLRGLFDTDGCIRFDRINNQRLNTYPRIEFCFASKCLRDDLFKLLPKLGFRCFIWGKTDYKIAMAGARQAERWFSEVSPANKRHLNRYEFWCKHGYFDAAVA